LACRSNIAAWSGNRPEGDAAMHGAFTVRRAALELGNALSTEISRAKSARSKRKA
jgi:hypothetical protein